MGSQTLLLALLSIALHWRVFTTAHISETVHNPSFAFDPYRPASNEGGLSSPSLTPGLSQQYDSGSAPGISPDATNEIYRDLDSVEAYGTGRDLPLSLTRSPQVSEDRGRGDNAAGSLEESELASLDEYTDHPGGDDGRSAAVGEEDNPPPKLSEMAPTPVFKFNDSFHHFQTRENQRGVSYSGVAGVVGEGVGDTHGSGIGSFDDGNELGSSKRNYFDGIASSLIKRNGSPVGSGMHATSSWLMGNPDVNNLRRLPYDHSVQLSQSPLKERFPAEVSTEVFDRESNEHANRFRDPNFQRVREAVEKDEQSRSSRNKRYLDSVASSLIKRNSLDNEKRYLDGVASSLIKRNSLDNEKRYLDGVASSLIKRNSLDNEKRYLDGVASSLIKRNSLDNEKRYLDGVASSLIKRNGLDNEKRYLDGVASSLIKREMDEENLYNEKRYLDGVASFLLKKDTGKEEKRYLDGVASSLIKKDILNNGKRYLDGVASSLIKKANLNKEKRYLDSVASSLIKRENWMEEKRYLDGVASSLIKKESLSNAKRYLDGVASSLIKKNNLENEKRYLDGVASSLIKKETSNSNKRYLDNVASSLIKKDSLSNEKRYLDGVASSLIKKNVGGNEKRYLDGVASSLIKKEAFRNDKRYLDGVSSSLIKKATSNNEKRYLDGVASSLIKRTNDGKEKRYLDGIATSLIKRDRGYDQQRYLNTIARALTTKHSGRALKRYLDGIASSLVKKESENQKRYLDGVASSLIKKEIGSSKRYLDGVASSLIKRSSDNALKKRTSEVVDDALNSPTEDELSEPLAPAVDNGQTENETTKPNSSRKRRDTSYAPSHEDEHNIEGTSASRVSRSTVRVQSHRNKRSVTNFEGDGGRIQDDFLEIPEPSDPVFSLNGMNPMLAGPTKRFRISAGGGRAGLRVPPHQRELSTLQRVRHYMDSVPGGLAYKRHEYHPVSVSSRGYQGRLGGYQGLALQSRLRTLKSSRAAPKGKKLSEKAPLLNPATIPGRRPNLMSAMAATGKGPDSEETKSYLRVALNDLVRQSSSYEANKRLPLRSGKPTVALQTSYMSSAPRPRFHSSRPDFASSRIKLGRGRGNFFDNLAGSLLT